MMIKRIKYIFGVILLTIFSFFSIYPAYAEEPRKIMKDPVAPQSASVRETEILGTLEKPQLNTEIRWKGPLINNFNSQPPRRSFKKEIFRPVHP
jgi:hypothetical protein